MFNLEFWGFFLLQPSRTKRLPTNTCGTTVQCPFPRTGDEWKGRETGGQGRLGRKGRNGVGKESGEGRKVFGGVGGLGVRRGLGGWVF